MKNIFEYGVTVVHLMVNLKLLPPFIRLPATEKEKREKKIFVGHHTSIHVPCLLQYCQQFYIRKITLKTFPHKTAT